MQLRIHRLLISLSLGLFAWQTASAQLAPADDFFDSGAQFYISNNIPAALKRVEMGLQTYPNNEKLKKLEQLLKQQQKQKQQQQQQKQKQQQQKNQQSKQQKSKNQQNKNQQNQQSSQQKSEQQKKQDEQQKKQAEKQKEEQQKQKEQQQSSAEKKKAEKQKKQQEKEGKPLKPGQMTPEQAKRLLDSQKGDEQILQLKPKKKSNPTGPLKDW